MHFFAARTRRFCVVACACCVSALTALVPVGAASTAGSPDLTGLWKAERHFGPSARGALVVERMDAGWVAEFIGGTFPVRVDGAAVTFALPDKLGAFSGTVSTDRYTIAGHWTQPNSVINGFQYATPVRLTATKSGRWQGQVVPVDDDCVFYLMVTRSADGTLQAFLRNPARNLGFQYGIDRLVVAGDHVTLMGRRGFGKAPEAAIARGSYDAETQGLSIMFPELGGTYDFVRDRSATSAFYPRGHRPKGYVYRAPPQLNDGWPTATLDDTNINRAGLAKFVQMIVDTPIDSVNAPEVEAILVARHGKLVLEEYFHGFDRAMLHDTRSAGKSITAVVAGAAMEAGAPLTLATLVYELMYGGSVPENFGPWKHAMTLRDLLTMRSGYYCNDSDPKAPGNEDNMIDSMLAGSGDPDFYHYVLNVPMAYPPDTMSVYCSTNPNLALGVVGRAAGQSPMDLFDRLIGGPLGISSYGWPLDGVGHPYGGGSIRIRPRDYLKIGQLMLNGGVWNGRRILGHDFVAESSAALHDMNMIQYGLLWWSIEYPYKKRTVRACFAGGNGGQAVMVVPALDLAVAIFAGNYGDHVGLHVQEDYVPNFILPAVREPGDDPRAPVIEQHFATPYAHPPVVVPTARQN
jgi:CubicO group peptidase (beta-lactamase class C family)